MCAEARDSASSPKVLAALGGRAPQKFKDGIPQKADNPPKQNNYKTGLKGLGLRMLGIRGLKDIQE